MVGLLTEDKAVVLEEGMQIVETASVQTGTASLGHVTSSYGEATLGRPIALALLADGRARIGETVFVPMGDGAARVRVVSPVFLDAAGERLNA